MNSGEAETRRPRRFSVGVQWKMAATYIAVIVGVLIVLNFYPVYVSQNFIFRSKQETLGARASLYSVTLGGGEALQSDVVSRVIELLDDGGTARVVVTDVTLVSIYDSSQASPATGKVLLLPEIRAALQGNNYFHAEYHGDTVESVASAPIMSGGQVVGAVSVYETDEGQAALLTDIRDNLWRMSVLVSIIVILIALLLSRYFTRRISILLTAMRRAHEGDYTYKSQMRGGDELAELSRELAELSRRFTMIEEMRRRFVSDASHELRTPLASVKLLADSIVQNADMPPETIREFMSDISAETDRLSRLADRLLSITRLDAVAAEIAPVELAAMCERVCKMLEPLAKRAGVTFKLRLQQCFIASNDDYAYQIVFNLAENAVKYNRTGGSVSIYLFENEDGVHLILDDTGIGIPPEDVDRVFERFYRVDKARSREAGGSGLGLAIVKTAVNHAGGRISVESKAGEGTRISVRFPRYGESNA